MQVVLMQPLLLAVGEKGTLLFALVASVIKWVGIGAAATKAQVFGFEGLGSFAFLALPMISSLKANAIPAHEQGALQGALSGVQAIAAGVGPLIFMLLWQALTARPDVLYLPRVRPLRPSHVFHRMHTFCSGLEHHQHRTRLFDTA